MARLTVNLLALACREVGPCIRIASCRVHLVCRGERRIYLARAACRTVLCDGVDVARPLHIRQVCEADERFDRARAKPRKGSHYVIVDGLVRGGCALRLNSSLCSRQDTTRSWRRTIPRERSFNFSDTFLIGEYFGLEQRHIQTF